MDLGYAGKSALVLASSGGIGFAIASELAAEGADVTLFGRSDERLAAAAATIGKRAGKEPRRVVGDVTDPAAIERAVAAASERAPLFALVNNSGGPKPGPFTALTDADWQQSFELTLLSYVRSVRAALPGMKANGGGRILNVSSSSTKRALENLGLSNVFRMGVLGLTKTLAMELGPDGILVNTVGAGKVATDRVRQIDEGAAKRAGQELDAFQAAQQKAIPLQRYGRPEEFARLCAFLCAPANTYVTGQNILVEGGAVSAY